MNNKSKLWKSITTSLFNNIDDDFFSNFRKPDGANSRLAVWNPYDPSLRYFKFLLFNIVKNKPKTFFDYYSKIKNTHTGKPVTVRYASCDIDVDYLLSVEEYIFLEENIKLANIKNITEIGAGFGRTCHTILSLSENIETYTIIDLPEVLKLSKLYLKTVIPEHFNKIQFISNEDDNHIKNLSPSDLVINIDSFQEMSPSTIDYYINNVVLNSQYFYTKNPIGKYFPEVVGLKNISKDKLLDVYSLGYCQDIYDIFNEDDLNKGRKIYCEKYLPNMFWEILNTSSVDIFPYFQNTIYKKK